nr:HIT domain protein [uncultured bacterium]AIA16316.1 HIT domain protein [uncultured bacterium]
MGGYNHSQARVPAQLKRMQDLDKRAVCAFCRENVETETTSVIEFETEHWIVKANDYPYERTKLHLLLIAKSHARTVTDLSPEAQADFLPLVARVERHYKLPSYAVAMRSGDFTYNGGTVDHLHAHIIVGDPKHPDPDPVRFKVSSRPKTTDA